MALAPSAGRMVGCGAARNSRIKRAHALRQWWRARTPWHRWVLSFYSLYLVLALLVLALAGTVRPALIGAGGLALMVLVLPYIERRRRERNQGNGHDQPR